jgi:hypothetical protein
MYKKFGLLSVLAVGVVLISACIGITQTGELQRESKSIALDGAEAVDVNIRMGAGKLTLAGGADGLVDAEFIYNVAEWQPTIDYVVSGERGELWIEQPEVKSLGLESYRYEWDLRLNDEVALDLDVALGAGENKIDASTLSLTRLDLKMGAGGVELDLTGTREEDVDVTVRGGVGEVTILLPSDVGVKAEVRGGLGELNVVGLTQDGDTYVNDAYGESDVTITLDVEGGVGEITLQVADSA